MTPEERLDAMAAILAKGYLAMLKARAAKAAGSAQETPADQTSPGNFEARG